MADQNEALARALSTDEQRRRRGQQAATKATGISAPSSRFDPLSIVEWATGLPVTDQGLFEDSKRDIFMRTVPQLATGALGGAAAAAGRRLMPPPPKPRLPHPSFDGLEDVAMARDRVNATMPHILALEDEFSSLIKSLPYDKYKKWRSFGSESSGDPAFDRINQIIKELEPLELEGARVGRMIPTRNVAIRVLSKKPHTRREFFGEARQAARDRHLDTHDRALQASNDADDKGAAIAADLNASLSPFEDGPETLAMEKAMERYEELARQKAMEAGEALKRFEAPSLLQRWKDLVSAPTDAAAEVGRQLATPSGESRRRLFQALARRLGGQ